MGPEELVMRTKARPVKIMVGVGASYRGLTLPAFVKPAGKIDGECYQDVLANPYPPSISLLYNGADRFRLKNGGPPARAKESAKGRVKANSPDRVEGSPHPDTT